MDTLTPDTQPTADPMRSIAEVERDTGLPRATLRIWERRYGFPAPGRDARGERCYPQEQVELLKLMRSLLDLGHRPAALIREGAQRIRELARQSTHAQPPSTRPRAAQRILKTLRERNAGSVVAELQGLLERSGLEHFAASEVPALNRWVGEAWAAGEIEIYEEHLYSDSVARVIRTAIAGLQPRPEAPRVLLTTLPEESHSLGLLVAEAMFALQGCPTFFLGTRLPVAQIVAAVRAYGADLVGLTCTGASNPSHVLRGLEELRGQLPSEVRLWVGGYSPALHRRKLPGVRVMHDVAHVPEALAEDFALPPRG